MDCSATVFGAGDFSEADNAKRDAVGAWNRRAERTCRAVLPPYEPGVEEIHVCSGCGRQLLLEDDDEYCPRCGAKITEEEP